MLTDPENIQTIKDVGRTRFHPIDADYTLSFQGDKFSNQFKEYDHSFSININFIDIVKYFISKSEEKKVRNFLFEKENVESKNQLIMIQTLEKNKKNLIEKIKDFEVLSISKESLYQNGIETKVGILESKIKLLQLKEELEELNIRIEKTKWEYLLKFVSLYIVFILMN
jgi:hypothetical protein